MAWIVAVVTIGAILALPLPALAQRDEPFRRQSSTGTSASTPTTGETAGTTSRSIQTWQRNYKIDIIDMRDATANMMMVEQPPAPGAGPLRADAVVCLAGCDTTPGSVVYRNTPNTSVASLSAPVAKPAPIPAPALAAAEPMALAQPLSCMAGCYEPPPVRTVASLREARLATAVPDEARRARSSSNAPIVASRASASPDTPPARLQAEPAATVMTPAPSTKLRTGFTPSRRQLVSKRSVVAARARAQKSQRMQRALGPTQRYGKVVAIELPKRATPPAAATAPTATMKAPPNDVPALEPAPHQAPSPPVSTFTPPRKPEPKRTDKTQPVTTVSNDWFNKLKREQPTTPTPATP